jgi:RimJ/RimL family protein N-acetyltransferase
MNASWVVRTGRLILRPVSYADLADLVRLKTDPRVFAVMLGGVRSPAAVAEELAADITFWGSHGMGMWAMRRPNASSASRACICARMAAAWPCALP